MTPLVGRARVCGLPPLTRALVTVMLPPLLKRMIVLPVYTSPPAVATVCSVELVGGIVSDLTPARLGPLNTGSPLGQLPPTFVKPGAGPVISIESALLRPNVGVPQVRMSSFVCIGPLIASASANWISEQLSSRWARYLSAQLACAHAWLVLE